MRDYLPHPQQRDVQHAGRDIDARETENGTPGFLAPLGPDREPARQPAGGRRPRLGTLLGRRQGLGHDVPGVELQIAARADRDLEDVAPGPGTNLPPQLRDAVPPLRLVEVQVELVRRLDGRPARGRLGLAAELVAGRGLRPPEHGQARGEVAQTGQRAAEPEDGEPALADELRYGWLLAFPLLLLLLLLLLLSLDVRVELRFWLCLGLVREWF